MYIYLQTSRGKVSKTKIFAPAAHDFLSKPTKINQNLRDEVLNLIEFDQKSCISTYKFQGEGLKNQKFHACSARFLTKIEQNLRDGVLNLVEFDQKSCTSTYKLLEGRSQKPKFSRLRRTIFDQNRPKSIKI